MLPVLSLLFLDHNHNRVEIIITTHLAFASTSQAYLSLYMPPSVFISYRASSDTSLAEQLYYSLTAQGVQVWWDAKRLAPGQPWEGAFADGLGSSAIFVPILCKSALAPRALLRAHER